MTPWMRQRAASLRTAVSGKPGRGPRWLCGGLVTLALLAAPVVLTSGCVRRTVTVNTDPQGAAVHLNDRLVGTSPVSVDFLWYGDYDVTLRKDGYQTLTTNHRLDAPWYQWPGLDFVSEVLVPWTIHDRQEMSFALEPAQPVDPAELLQKAVETRERTLYGDD